jgi:hypothetical protein
MPKHDEHTKEFMRQVAGDNPPAEPTHISLTPLRISKSLLDIAKNPERGISKFLVRKTVRDLMEKDSSLNVLGVYFYMNEHHGREWWDWEPETIWHTLESSHLTDATQDEIKNMVMALQTVLNTFAPFEHWHIFEKVSHAFNQNHVDFSVLQPTEPDDIAATMAILGKIRPKTDYEPEVLIYIATCAKVAGMVYLPDELFPGVQKYLDDITVEHLLRDATKKVWEGGELPKAGLFRDQVELQISRCQEVKDYVAAEVR